MRSKKSNKRKPFVPEEDPRRVPRDNKEVVHDNAEGREDSKYSDRGNLGNGGSWEVNMVMTSWW